jgi:hypothetical protein
MNGNLNVIFFQTMKIAVILHYYRLSWNFEFFMNIKEQLGQG